MDNAIKIFITYAHKDKVAKDKLVTHLNVLMREGLIVIRDDNEITPGNKWRDAIFTNLAESNLLLHLVSTSSLTSKFRNRELAKALDAKIKIIPIILETCDWLNHPLSDYQTLPEHGKPINEWIPESKGWQNVANGIRHVAEEIRAQISGGNQKGILFEWVFQQGNFMMTLGQLDRAIEAYSLAVELKPDFAGAYACRGVAYYEKREYNRTIVDCNKAIQLDPELVEAYYNRGNAQYREDRYDQAIDDYNISIQLKPEFVQAYYNRGLTHYTLRDFDRAINDYSKAIELNPMHAVAHNNRGIAYYKKGEYNRAIEDYDTAIELDYIDAYYNRGEAWLHLREWDKAKEDLITAKKEGVDIVAAFRNEYKNIAAFERANQVKLPEDIAALVRQGFRNRYPKKEKVLTADGKPLDSQEVYNLMNKLRDAGAQLGECIKTQPFFGIKTTPTDVFVVDRKTRDKLYCALSEIASFVGAISRSRHAFPVGAVSNRTYHQMLENTQFSAA